MLGSQRLHTAGIVDRMLDQINPHDAVFRRVLGIPVNAASQLRAALPAGLVDRLDLKRLERVPDSYVNPKLRAKYSDLVFSVPFDDSDRFAYVLLEHQSRNDVMMSCRMLDYAAWLWDRYRNSQRRASRLPPVIPLVVHSGRRPWSGSLELADLIDIDTDSAHVMPELAPRFRLWLDDLATVDVQALRDRPLTAEVRLTHVLLKLAPRNRRLAAGLRGWEDEVRAILSRTGGREILSAQVEYIRRVAETPEEELREWFAQVGSNAEEVFVTTEEMVMAKGEAKGLAKTLLRLMKAKFGPLPQATVDTVHAATVEQLEAWTDRILFADSIDQVFG